MVTGLCSDFVWVELVGCSCEAWRWSQGCALFLFKLVGCSCEPWRWSQGCALVLFKLVGCPMPLCTVKLGGGHRVVLWFCLSWLDAPVNLGGGHRVVLCFCLSWLDALCLCVL